MNVKGVYFYKRGSVTEVYKSTRGAVGQQDTLYAVLWDGEGEPERGYLEVGLEREPHTTGVMHTEEQ